MNQILFHFWHVENGLENGAASRLDRRAIAPIVVLLKTGGRKKLLWSVFKRTSRKVPGMEGLFMTVEIDWVPMTSASSSCLERMEKRV